MRATVRNSIHDWRHTLPDITASSKPPQQLPVESYSVSATPNPRLFFEQNNNTQKVNFTMANPMMQCGLDVSSKINKSNLIEPRQLQSHSQIAGVMESEMLDKTNKLNIQQETIDQLKESIYNIDKDNRSLIGD